MNYDVLSKASGSLVPCVCAALAGGSGLGAPSASYLPCPPSLPQRLSNVPAGILEEGSIVPLFGQFPPWDSGRHSTTTKTDYLETELQVRDCRRRLDALPMAGPGLWAAQAGGRGRNLVGNLPPRSHHVLNWPDDCPRCHQNSQTHFFHAKNPILSIIPQVG